VRLLISSLCVCLALATAATAQQTPARLTELHDALHLAAGQEGTWQSYTAAIAPDPQSQARRAATQALLPQLPTPRRLALVEAAMTRDFADFRRQSAAVKAFYAGLTPVQQAIFDRQSLPAGSDQTGR